MKTNTKALALTLLATTIIASTASFAANTSSTGILNPFKQMTVGTDAQKAQMQEVKTILDKQKAGTKLTQEEQTKLDQFQANRNNMGRLGGRGGKHDGMGEMGMGKGTMGGINQLTDEEKTKLESMTDAEKKVFFEAKRAELEAKMEAREAVIDKLVNGETLTQEEEVLRQEIKTQRAEMKAKRAEMKEIRALMEKNKNGETLTQEEQAKLDQLKANMPDMGKRETKGFDRN